MRGHKKYDLKDKIGWITGAASGLGRALAVELDRRGMRLVLIDKDRDGLADLQSALGANNRHATVCIDLTVDPALLAGRLDALEAPYRDIDILANCAGYVTAGCLTDIPHEGFRHSLDVNFNAPLILIQHAIKAMKQKKSGQIVNITSAMSRRGVPFFSAYCAAKAALNALTDSIRCELSADNINVMLVAPGTMATNIFRNAVVFGDVDTNKINFPGMRDPRIMARKIARGLEKKAPRITQFSAVEILLLINRLFPSLVDRIFRKTILDKLGK